MSYVAHFYGMPVFEAWLGMPDRAYGIDVYGSVVSPTELQAFIAVSTGNKVFMARFPVDVTYAFFYACPGGYCTEPIYVGLDVPSRTVYVALVGARL